MKLRIWDISKDVVLDNKIRKELRRHNTLAMK